MFRSEWMIAEANECVMNFTKGSVHLAISEMDERFPEISL